MDEKDVNSLILEKIIALSEGQAALKSSVEAHLETVNDFKSQVREHDTILRQHSIFFKIFFWVGTTVASIVAVAKFKS